MMNMEENMNLLRNVTKVEAPVFLYTRIEAKIDDLEGSSSTFSKWTLASLALVVCLNFVVSYSYLNSSSTNQSNPYQETANQFYYE